MLKKALLYYRIYGLKAAWLLISSRLPLDRKLKAYGKYAEAVRGKSGLEVGGPSRIFNTGDILPLYDLAGKLDSCDFSGSTLWNKGEPGGQIKYDKKYICEAADMSDIPSSTYDFLLSSHVLEHIADPIKALKEWARVLKDGGYLLIAVPHRDGSFDHLRPVTEIAHIIKDHEMQVKEDDLTHLDEILRLHDLNLDPGISDRESFRQRSMDNRLNRALHHHVFDTQLMVKLLDHLGLQIISVDTAFPSHIITLSKKSKGGPDNRDFLSGGSR